MANYTQYNGNVGSSYYNFFLSHVPFGKEYLIFRTEDYYVCVYGDYEQNNTFKNSTVIKISTTYNQQNNVSYSSENSTSVTINYEFYSYSNVGVGTILSHPDINNRIEHHETLQTSLLFVILLVTIGFNIIRKRWIDNDK